MLWKCNQKLDGTLRGPADILLLETPPSSGYYTNNDRPDLVVGDMVIIKDSKTGNVGSGEWKPEDATDVKKGKDNVNVTIYGNVRARNFQIAGDASIEEKKIGIIKKILKIIGTIVVGIIVTVTTDILGDLGLIKWVKTIFHNILTHK